MSWDAQYAPWTFDMPQGWTIHFNTGQGPTTQTFDSRGKGFDKSGGRTHRCAVLPCWHSLGWHQLAAVDVTTERLRHVLFQCAVPACGRVFRLRWMPPEHTGLSFEPYDLCELRRTGKVDQDDGCELWAVVPGSERAPAPERRAGSS